MRNMVYIFLLVEFCEEVDCNRGSVGVCIWLASQGRVTVAHRPATIYSCETNANCRRALGTCNRRHIHKAENFSYRHYSKDNSAQKCRADVHKSIVHESFSVYPISNAMYGLLEVRGGCHYREEMYALYCPKLDMHCYTKLRWQKYECILGYLSDRRVIHSKSHFEAFGSCVGRGYNGVD